MRNRVLNLVLVLSLVLVLGVSAVYAAPPAQDGGTEYVVKEGDTLWSLAEEHLGNGAYFTSIVAATNEKNASDASFAKIPGTNVIQPGWKLFIPEEASAPAAGVRPAVPEQHISADAIVLRDLLYPEAPYWSTKDDLLYFVEWSGDKIWKYKDGKAEVFYQAQTGDGPCGLVQDGEGNLWVAMYSSLKVQKLSPAGEVLLTIDSYNGEPFKGPNDVVMDARGGLYFTDSGNFEDDWVEAKPVGSVYYYSPAGELTQVDSGLVYANGISLSLDGKTLYVDEHRKNRILKYTVNDDGTLSDRAVFFEPDDEYLGEDPSYSYELGTDGMWRDSQGNLWVAHYGGGKVMVINPEGKLLTKLILPEGIYPTNTTLSADEKTLFITEGGVGLLYQVGIEMPIKIPPGILGFRRIPPQVPGVVPTTTTPPTKIK